MKDIEIEFLKAINDMTQLKSELASKKSPHDHFSGSHKKMTKLLKKIERKGYVEASDKALSDLVKEKTIIDEDGYSFVNLPDDFSEEQNADCMVWLVINDKGREVLKTGH